MKRNAGRQWKKGGKETGKEAKREMWVSWARPPDPSGLTGDCHARLLREINPRELWRAVI